MLTIGVLCSGGLGLDTLSKIKKDYTIQFVLTDSNSTEIIDFAIKNEIPFYAGNPRKGKGYSFIKNYKTDVVVSINYLFLIEEDIINHSSRLTFNIHGSLLPKYRGRTPHVWAIINGENKTGITAHVIDAGCDTGKLIHQIEIPIAFEDTGATMLVKYAKQYYPLVKKVLNDLLSKQLNLRSQNEEEASYYGKRTPVDGEINWSWTKEVIRNWIRAQAYPYPGAFSFLNNQKIVIDRVSVDEGFSSFEDGTIIAIKPKVSIKVKNGIVILEEIRTKNNIFEIGKKFKNEDR